MQSLTTQQYNNSKVSRRIFLRYLVAGVSVISLDSLLSACEKTFYSTQNYNPDTPAIAPRPTQTSLPAYNPVKTETLSFEDNFCAPMVRWAMAGSAHLAAIVKNKAVITPLTTGGELFANPGAERTLCKRHFAQLEAGPVQM